MEKRGFSYKESTLASIQTIELAFKKQATSSEDFNQNSLEDYQLIRLLGSGAYATVKLA